MTDFQAMGLRMEQRRKQLGLTLVQVANAVGVASSTIQRYEKGQFEKIKLPIIESIASALDVNPDWLICKTDDPSIKRSQPFNDLPDNIIPLPRTVKIPLIGSIACGTPVLAVENLEGYIDMPDHVHADFALRCKGDSMIGARIFDGDIVYIKKQDIVDDGQIAAVLIGEEATLKRVRFYPDHIVLEPANPAIEPWAYWREEMNEVHIIGLAVAFTSMVRH